MAKTCIVIPTYNEAENIEELIREILALNIFGMSILVVDDDSPDGTGELAERLSKEDPRIKVLRRKERGRGTAGIQGFKAALALNHFGSGLADGADYVIEMDADFSHHPRYIPDLLKHIESNDVVIGSRFVKGGKDSDRGTARKIITLFAQNYIRRMLGLKVRDITSGYRCFRRGILERIDLDHMVSTGPSIVSEILYKCSLEGARMYETPITFMDRVKGHTKLNLAILLKTLYMVYRFKRIYKK
jgi:dolichol-phosphate mannosyltransferase